MVYGPSGMGKSTLAALAPDPRFIGLDDGGRKLRHPITGEPLKYIPGVETFQDIRDAVRQADLFPEGSTLVLDTITKAEILAEKYTFDHIKHEKGHTVDSIEGYGFGKGYIHLTETMRLLLTDLDGLIRRGVNVILLAQESQHTIANLAGTDYLRYGPKLYTAKNGTGAGSEVCEWADHVFRLGHPDVSVSKANDKATKGKVRGSTDRVVYTAKELYFVAKSRPIDGYNIPAVIGFETQADDSLWAFLFRGARAE